MVTLRGPVQPHAGLPRGPTVVWWGAIDKGGNGRDPCGFNCLIILKNYCHYVYLEATHAAVRCFRGNISFVAISGNFQRDIRVFT
jgi:hypothetical protein